MKTILRFFTIALLLMTTHTAMAQEPKVTFDFTTNTWGLPEGSFTESENENTYNNGTYSITLKSTNGDRYYYNTSGYLILGKKNATMTFPAFDFKVGKIVVTGGKNASTLVEQNIMVGEDAVSTVTTGAADPTTKEALANEYVISEAYQAANTIYTLKILSSHNTRITKIEFYESSSADVPEESVVRNESTATFTWAEATADQQSEELTYTVDPLTLTATIAEGGTNPKEEADGDLLRLYKNNVLTITAAEGYLIGKLHFDFSSNSFDASRLVYNGTTLDAETTALELEAPAQSLALTTNAQCGFSQITVTYYKCTRVSVSNYGYSTLCSDIALDFSCSQTIKAYRATTNGDVLTLTQADMVAAGEGVLLHCKTGAATEYVPQLTTMTLTYDNDMVGVSETSGVTITPSDSEYKYYYFSIDKDGENAGFYKPSASGTTIPQGKAYLRTDITNE